MKNEHEDTEHEKRKTVKGMDVVYAFNDKLEDYVV
jgi:histone H3/H4